MDTRTGEIFEGKDIEDLIQQAKKADKFDRTEGQLLEDLVPLKKLPTSDCKRCKGTGRRRAGVTSKRFKPCKCTEK